MSRISKSSLLIENILIFGVGGVIGRIIPLIMVPIITRLLPDASYYGVNDLVDAIVQLGCALAVFGMYEALYRIYFDKKDKDFKIKCCSTALFFNIITSCIIFVALIIFRDQLANIVFNEGRFDYLVIIAAFSTLIGSTNNIISAPTRMQNKRLQYLIIHFGSAIISYAIAIPMIISGYYYVALPLASLLSALLVEITFFLINRSWFSFKQIDFHILKQLLKLAIPLFPNLIIYWLFSFSDKIMISNLSDTASVGVYSAGSKIAHIGQIFYTAFSTGWQYVAYSTMHEGDQIKSNSKIFSFASTISFIFLIAATSLSFSVFKIVFEGEYIEGYIVMPLLFMAPLLQIQYQICCSQLIIAKNAKSNLFITLSGALVNVILNLLLIPIIGIEGASIATFIGYSVTVVAIVCVLLKKKLLILNMRILVNLAVTTVYYISWRLCYRQSPFGIFWAIIAISILLFVNRKEIFELPKTIIGLIGSKRKDKG